MRGAHAPLLAAAALLLAAAARLCAASDPYRLDHDETYEYINLACEANVSLDDYHPKPLNSTFKPNFNKHQVKCAVPRSGYKRILDDLNVGLQEDGALLLHLPAAAHDARALAALHLAGLHLGRLELRAAAGAPRPPDGDLLAGRELRFLIVSGVPLAPDALSRLPGTRLKLLVLEEAGVKVVPAELLRNLTSLHLRQESGPVVLEGTAPVLRSLRLNAPGPAPELHSFPKLEILTLIRWNEESPAAWKAGQSLRKLYLSSPQVSELPRFWLARCCRLELLEVTYAQNLTKLPPELLAGCAGPRALSWLTMRKCGRLEPLPADLLSTAPNLTHLDLSSNLLETLDGSMFSNVKNLSELILSDNLFKISMYTQLSSLKALTLLDLSGNARLGDACNSTGDSALRSMTGLRELHLDATRVSRICRDWRQALTSLELLNLQRTAITMLSYADVFQYRRIADVSKPRVDLFYTKVTTVEFTDEEVESLGNKTDTYPGVEVNLSEPLVCDCNTANAAIALNRIRNSPFQYELTCRTSRGSIAMSKMDLDDMVCENKEMCERVNETGCSCWHRPTSRLHWLRGVVRCEGAGLRRLPAMPVRRGGGEVEWVLRLANNSIARLHALPDNLRILDVARNKISEVSADAAFKLQHLESSGLRLSHNPIPCSCETPLLKLVANYPPLLGDSATCAGSSKMLGVAALEPLPPCDPDAKGALAAALGAVLAALALAAAGVGAALARPSRRARLKGVLIRLGCLPRPRDDTPYEYDAFVSFVMADWEFVREMVRRLESGASPLRLCLHYRDWPPGEFVPAQIEKSVRVSRRTVVVVSSAFLLSEWSRAELYEALSAGARAGTPRLVAVLLADPAELRVKGALRRYLAGNTYLHAENPRFWWLLRKALAAPSCALPAHAVALATSAAPQVSAHTPLPAGSASQESLPTPLPDGIAPQESALTLVPTGAAPQKLALTTLPAAADAPSEKERAPSPHPAPHLPVASSESGSVSSSESEVSAESWTAPPELDRATPRVIPVC